MKHNFTCSLLENATTSYTFLKMQVSNLRKEQLFLVNKFLKLANAYFKKYFGGFTQRTLCGTFYAKVLLKVFFQKLHCQVMNHLGTFIFKGDPLQLNKHLKITTWRKNLESRDKRKKKEIFSWSTENEFEDFVRCRWRSDSMENHDWTKWGKIFFYLSFHWVMSGNRCYLLSSFLSIKLFLPGCLRGSRPHLSSLRNNTRKFWRTVA